jgi:CheY-like chemotaxis protein
LSWALLSKDVVIGVRTGHAGDGTRNNTQGAALVPSIEEKRSGMMAKGGSAGPRPGNGTSLAQRIAPILPSLRRYARALSGNQAEGDARVARLLEAMVDDPARFDLGADERVGLFRAFQRLWKGAEPVGYSPDPRERAVASRLTPLAPSARHALLLTALEGFSLAQTAAIMEQDLSAVTAMVEEGRAVLHRQSHARVLIIEDEPIIAMDIEALVTDIGHTVVDIVDTRDLAVKAAREHRPDIVLADIQLADGSSGIEAAQAILKRIALPVVFITAYPDRLLTGRRPEPTFLISKPFRAETVKATVAQALFFRSAAVMSA